uniref:Unconventional myosin n=1 Tax=Tanacetum cinerariifolium TaxID=118510 RepID=A0A699GTC2_TANCI|nr:unconventional myosin [Tanacetum cinerariifolium]
MEQRVVGMEVKTMKIGKTKVFLRAGQMAELDAGKAGVLGNATRITQRQMHTYIARKEYISIRKATIQLQASWRACKQFKQLRKQTTAVKIQKDFRCFVAITSYQTLRVSSIALQTGLRAMNAFDDFRHRNQTKAAICMLTTAAAKHILTTRVFRKLHYILNLAGGEAWPGESYGNLKWLPRRVGPQRGKRPTRKARARTYMVFVVGEATKGKMSHPFNAEMRGATRKRIITTHWRLYRETKTGIKYKV